MQNKENADRSCMKVLNPEIWKHGISKPVQKFIYHKSSIKPPGGLISFQALFGVGGGLKERGAYLI